MKKLLLFLTTMVTMAHLNTSPISVLKKTLSNGLTVLVRPVETTQKVSIQLWYHVGSKDEKSGERGLAHLLEHMIFKGTPRISESDIALITKKLSGWCNAHTSSDWTFYEFNVPAHNYAHTLPILADCMRNCTFKEDLLNAEFKVVIQELKMNRDNYPRSLFMGLITSIFADHPYHYPTIGFKQDIWAIDRQQLLNFYHKHYVPNNAALVIVGDVNPDEVFAEVEKTFGTILADPTYKKEQFYHNRELASQEVVLYRDVKLPYLMVTFQIPGYKTHDAFAVDAISQILTGGKSSRLYKRLVDELQLVNWIQCFNVEFLDHDLLDIHCEPKHGGRAEIQQIITIIQEELDALGTNGADKDELQKVMLQSKQAHFSLLENSNAQARAIGLAFLARGDENYPFTCVYDDAERLNAEIKNIVSSYCMPELQHRGVLLPLSERGEKTWRAIMANGDAEDVAFLAQRERQSLVEEPLLAHSIEPGEPKKYVHVVPESFQLANGLTVYTHQRSAVPKIALMLNFKPDMAYSQDDLLGLCNIMCALMYEGTKNYPGAAFANAAELHGINFDISPGRISIDLLPEQLEFGLHLLNELVIECSFDEDAITKLKARALADWARHLDSPKSIASQKAREYIYKGHPYAQNAIANPDVIASITRTQLVDLYKNWMTPVEASLVVVGDLDEAPDLRGLIDRSLGSWSGGSIDTVNFPALQPVSSATVDTFLSRDQIVLTYAGLSVHRLHPDFDKLLLFDHIFGRGMDSRLFHLREQYGIFYNISGSCISGADEQPGMVLVNTIVSKDRLAQAEQLIEQAIATVIDDIREDELAIAKQTVLNDMAEMYATNKMTANTFLFLNKYQLPYDYAAQRAQRIQGITLDEVKAAARQVLQNDALVKVRVGRLDGALPVRGVIEEAILQENPA